jgi:hypothetical protein
VLDPRRLKASEDGEGEPSSTLSSIGEREANRKGEVAMGLGSGIGVGATNFALVLWWTELGELLLRRVGFFDADPPIR